METEKSYKTKLYTRNTVKRYNDNLKQKNPEQYFKYKEYHREYSKLYYKKLKEARILLDIMNGTHDFII